MRGDQLSRQWRVLRQLEVSKKGITANNIAELGGTSLRTAYRDLDDLQLAGFITSMIWHYSAMPSRARDITSAKPS